MTASTSGSENASSSQTVASELMGQAEAARAEVSGTLKQQGRQLGMKRRAKSNASPTSERKGGLLSKGRLERAERAYVKARRAGARPHSPLCRCRGR